MLVIALVPSGWSMKVASERELEEAAQGDRARTKVGK